MTPFYYNPLIIFPEKLQPEFPTVFTDRSFIIYNFQRTLTLQGSEH